MSEPREGAAPEPFCSFEYEGMELYQEFQQLITDGALPFDAAFRLASVGVRQPDPRSPKYTYYWKLLGDMVTHAGDPTAMRSDAQALLFGERPEIIIDDNIRVNKEWHAWLDPMYYRIGNLATTVKEDRADRGKTMTETPPNVWLSPKEYEWSICVGLARPIWRILIQRTCPDIFENPKDYQSPIISFDQVYFINDNTARRRNTNQAVISDTAVHRLYLEAEATGVRGIGPAGRRHLRQLLVDEHPELMEGYEVKSQ